MIERVDKDIYVLHCDHCEDDIEDYFETFQDAVNYKKDNGWKSIKNKKTGEWHEVCPECAALPGTYKKFAGIVSR